MNDVNSVIYAGKILHKTLKKWEFYDHHYYIKRGAMASVNSVLTLK